MEANILDKGNTIGQIEYFDDFINKKARCQDESHYCRDS